MPLHCLTRPGKSTPQCKIISLHYHPFISYTTFSHLVYPHISINLMLNGLKRERRDRPFRSRKPITPEMMLAIHASFDIIPRKCRKPFWVACVLAFFSLLRTNNLFPDKYNAKHLRINGIVIKHGRLVSKVSALKTIKFIAHQHVIPVHSVGNPVLCPVSAFKALVSRKTVPVMLRCFHIALKREKSTQQRTAFQIVSQKDASRWWIHPAPNISTQFSSNGLTYAATAGANPALLNSQGTWSSNCYLQSITCDCELRKQHSSLVSRDLVGFSRDVWCSAPSLHA